MPAVERLGQPSSIYPGCFDIPDRATPAGPLEGISLTPGPSILPCKILFGARPDRRLRFKQPLEVELFAGQGSVVACAESIGEFGHGDSMGEALDDLRKTLTELYLSHREVSPTDFVPVRLVLVYPPVAHGSDSGSNHRQPRQDYHFEMTLRRRRDCCS